MTGIGFRARRPVGKARRGSQARDNARRAGAARGFGAPASARVGFGAQPRLGKDEATPPGGMPRPETYAAVSPLKYCPVSRLTVPARNAIPIRLGNAMKPLSSVPIAHTSGTETIEPTMISSVNASR